MGFILTEIHFWRLYMFVSSIQSRQHSQFNNSLHNLTIQNSAQKTATPYQVQYAKVPSNFQYGAQIHFGERIDRHRTIPDIDFDKYHFMSDTRRKFFRKRYENFTKTASFNADELFDKTQVHLPLHSEHDMDEFIKTASIYKKYKDQPIICLGRSPKWFLNGALWMKDGIKKYTFVAFSKFWYRPDREEGVKKLAPQYCPKENEIKEYRKYLKDLKADPKSIVENFEKTGKKTVITDFIATGKGATSFLDTMANYADDLGILEKFSKSIQFVGIGSMDYLEDLNPYADSYSEPQVFMPEKLQPYGRNIKQEFYKMDYNMFKDMLVNQNTNECRSSFYPHYAWTLYKPNQFKTGFIKNAQKIQELVEKSNSQKKLFVHFSPTMRDYRNLVNFRILDGLNARGLLKLK